MNFNGLTDSQKRLFAVRCARRVQHLMTEPRSVAALDVAERYALGQASGAELTQAYDEAWAAARELAWDAENASRRASWAAAWAALSDAARAARDAASRAASAVASDAAWAAREAARGAAWVAANDAAWDAAMDAEREAQAKILEEIRGMR